MTKIYLAYARVAKCKRIAFGQCSRKPRFLFSYFYLPGAFKEVRSLPVDTWCLDSGAYSAQSLATPIKNEEYCRFILEHLPSSQVGPPEIIFGLDVIGDWKAGSRNAREAWDKGIQVVPTWHHGEPFDVLRGLARDYPKIAIGGMARGTPKQKAALIDKCFNMIWPKLIHGFGVTTPQVVDHVPFDTIDSNTWINPLRYGYYPRTSAGTKKLRTCWAHSSVRGEVEFYLRKERSLAGRWGSVLAPLRQEYARVLVETPYQAVSVV